MSLSASDLAVLQFESEHPGVGARKNEAIRTELGLNPVRYYQKLSILIERADALQFDPVLVHRLRRIREQQLREKSNRAAPRSSN